MRVRLFKCFDGELARIKRQWPAALATCCRASYLDVGVGGGVGVGVGGAPVLTAALVVGVGVGVGVGVAGVLTAATQKLRSQRLGSAAKHER